MVQGSTRVGDSDSARLAFDVPPLQGKCRLRALPAALRSVQQARSARSECWRYCCCWQGIMPVVPHALSAPPVSGPALTSLQVVSTENGMTLSMRIGRS